MALQQPEVVDITDDRPIAVRRKRRSSSALADPPEPSRVPKAKGELGHLPVEAAKTPTKAKKRVRFSDPGPEISQSCSSSSTGLTPYLRRTSFKATPPSSSRPFSAAPHRLSLPTSISISLPSPSLSLSPGPLSGEVQFAPLRQVLDDRSKRRLRRNNLSEEINDIDSEKRPRFRLSKEIEDLKCQLAEARRLPIKDEGAEDFTVAGAGRIRELEQELFIVKEELRERPSTAEPLVPFDHSTPVASTQYCASPSNMIAFDRSTPPADPINSTLGSHIFVDNVDDDDEVVRTSFDKRVLQDRTLTERPSIQEEDPDACPPAIAVSQSTTQVSPLHPDTESLRSARLSLEYLFPGEIALGLIPEDPKPLLQAMLDRLRRLKAQVLVAEDSLSTTKTYESNLRTQFNAVLEQLSRARGYADQISTRHANERARADAAQMRSEILESDAQDASSKVEELKCEANEKDNSIQKLQDALETYRVEVAKLETLITDLEDDHNTAMSTLRAEMDEAVADLECHVTAETIGRRAAEHEAEERDEKIKELRVREQELLNAVNEKQMIIRETERIFGEERTGREREVGGLNVRIGELSSNLSESRGKLAKTDQVHEGLLRNLEEEKEAGLRAVAAVREELTQCSHNAQGIKDAYISDVQRRGAEVNEHKGLLTPVSACRFHDVEGYVEVRRGKSRKRPDSGIEMLKEDEDEDLIMADM